LSPGWSVLLTSFFPACLGFSQESLCFFLRRLIFSGCFASFWGWSQSVRPSHQGGFFSKRVVFHILPCFCFLSTALLCSARFFAILGNLTPLLNLGSSPGSPSHLVPLTPFFLRPALVRCRHFTGLVFDPNAFAPSKGTRNVLFP